MRGYKWHVKCLGLEPWLGIYEQQEMGRLKEFVKKGDVFYDLGAHEGMFTLYGSKLVGATGQLFSFEPIEQNLGYLKRHILMNNCQNVKVFQFVVLDKPDTVKLKLGVTFAEGHVSNDGTISIQATSIDDLVYNKNLPAPDVLKIDVQGAEALVLEGMKKTIANHKVKMLIACHSQGVNKPGWTTKACLEILKNLGCKVIPVDNKELTISKCLYAFN
jgi:FkbM family methyltransferase